ncbi:MAG: SDR family oxidoreductase [Pseudomonadota bacterium]
MSEVKNKNALVTGANRGIGKVIVEALLDNGAEKVYVGVRTLSSADALVDKYGERVEVIEIDLSKPDTITDAASKATDVHIVINNAGVLKNASPLDDHALETLAYEMDINVNGLIRMAQAFSPVLKENGGGTFVQLNSVASIKNFMPFTTYSASKAAAYSVTQGLKEALGEQGTRVISVHPGPIATDMANDAGLGDMAEPATLVSESIIDALNSDEFHVFPDTMAKQFHNEYKNYAESIVEVNLMEG